MRHGEAAPEQLDPRRPLTDAGRRDVERVARSAAARQLRIAEILHSGVLRARETAEIFALHLRPEKGVRQSGGLLPQDDPMVLRAELQAAEEPVLVVGHLPHLGRLVASLVSGDPERPVADFGPATLVCCAREAARWNVAWVLSPQTA